jgi:hypothetical protein
LGEPEVAEAAPEPAKLPEPEPVAVEPQLEEPAPSVVESTPIVPIIDEPEEKPQPVIPEPTRAPSLTEVEYWWDTKSHARKSATDSGTDLTEEQYDWSIEARSVRTLTKRRGSRSGER